MSPSVCDCDYPVFKAQSQRPSSVALPRIDARGKRVLDVGCGAGKDLLHPIYAEAAQRCGIDVDAELVEYGRSQYPQLGLTQGFAESLPYPAEHFDLVVSRVALPYTDIPRALAEIQRVMQPGGYLYLTMHDWRHQLGWFGEAIRKGAWKRVVDHVYIAYASVAYWLTGKVPARPWNGRRETWQTRRRLKRSLELAGFAEVLMGRTDRHFIVQAIKKR